MKIYFPACLLTTCVGLLAASLHAADAPWQMTVQTDKPGAKINPSFYGLMTEEINHAYDGGLYAELIQNRVFKDNDHEPIHWSLVQGTGGEGTMSLDKTNPVNPALINSLRLEITTPGQRVGVSNEGFCNYSKGPGGRVVSGPGGMPVMPNSTYKVTFWAKANGMIGSLTASLESRDGKTIYAQSTVNGVMGDWHKFTLELKIGADVQASLNNRFVLYANKAGTVWLGFVSLFPPTYKNRTNGNRIDLDEKLAAMHPAFLRMPGGNYVDPGHYEWKKTIGPVDQRPGHMGAWDYRVSDGLGLLEFFLWCEDLNMEPLLAVTDGRGWLPGNGDVTPLVQDALDEIEYATGDTSTKWGAKRAADGHPAPFKLHYVEIGNEDFFDPREVYEARFQKFFDAIRAKYPQLKIIATRRDMHTPRAGPDRRSHLRERRCDGPSRSEVRSIQPQGAEDFRG